MGVSMNSGVSSTGDTYYAGLIGAPAASLGVPSFRLTGDSIASQIDSVSAAATGSTSMAITRYPYWWAVVCELTGYQINHVSTISPVTNLRYGSNSAKGGEDMDELKDRLPGILTTMPETYLVICIGTNDINAGTALASLNADFVEITDMVLAAGKIPIWTTVLPRNGVDGANDWGATGNTAAQKRLIMASHNKYRKDYCRENGIICSSWHTAIENASGDATTGTTVDGLHPGGIGGYKLGQYLLGDIGHLIPQSGPKVNPYDVYDATYNPYGNILNGALTGTGGATSAGSGTGTINGTIPDNFQLQKATSTTTDVFAAIVPRSDGRPGNVLELTFNSYGTGASSENWRLNYWTGATTSLSSWGIKDDLLQMACEIEYVGGHGGILLAAGPRVANSGAVTKSGTTISFNNTTKQILDSSNGFGSFVGSRLAVVSGATNGANNSVFKITTAAAGVLQLDLSSTLVTESAGASVSVSIPSMAVVAYGSSTTKAPDEDTPVFWRKTPVMTMPFTGNLVPRIDIFVNGTIAGMAKVRIGLIELRKLPITPSLLSYQADDTLGGA